MSGLSLLNGASPKVMSRMEPCLVMICLSGSWCFFPKDHVVTITKGADHHDTGPFIMTHCVGCNDGNTGIKQWADSMASDEVLVALIVWVDSNRNTRR